MQTLLGTPLDRFPSILFSTKGASQYMHKVSNHLQLGNNYGLIVGGKSYRLGKVVGEPLVGLGRMTELTYPEINKTCIDTATVLYCRFSKRVQMVKRVHLERPLRMTAQVSNSLFKHSMPLRSANQPIYVGFTRGQVSQRRPTVRAHKGDGGALCRYSFAHLRRRFR